MKALLKYRIKSVLPALIVGIVVLIAAVVFVFVDFRMMNNSPFYIDTGTFFLERITYNLVFLPFALLALAIWMGMVLTKDYGNKERENFLDALPCKRSTRFLVSLLPGVLYFVLCGIVLNIAVCISHSVSYEYFRDMNMISPFFEEIMECDRVENALLVLWHIVLSGLMVFWGTFFAGVVSRNKLVAVFIVMAMCLFSIFVPEVKYGKLSDVFLFPDSEYVFDTFFVIYNDMWPKIITMLALCILYAVLTYVVAVKIKRESGKLIVNDVCEKIGIVIAGIYGALIVRFVMKTGEVNTVIIIVAMVLTFGIIVFGLSKFVAGKGKYSFLNASLIAVLLLSGCGNAKLPENVQEQVLVDRGTKEVLVLKELFLQTSVKEYMFEQEGLEEGDERISISPEKVISKYAKENNRETIEVSDEEWKEFYYIGIANQSEFKYVIDDEVIYIENSEGKLVNNRGYLLLSRCEDVKNVLIESNNEAVYEVFLELDNNIIKQIENKDNAYPAASSSAFNCLTIISSNQMAIINHFDWGWSEPEYLVELQKMDGFSIECGAINEVGDSLCLFYSGELDDEQIDFIPVSTVRLDMFGKNGELNELRLVIFDELEIIPVQCKPTIENCLLNLGCTEEEISEFFKDIPDKNGKIGNLTYSVDKMQGKYKIIKIYGE